MLFRSEAFFGDQGSALLETAVREREANLYAAELLMPNEDLLSDLPDLYEPGQIPSQVEHLALKFRFPSRPWSGV